jgi:hypothetical protein
VVAIAQDFDRPSFDPTSGAKWSRDCESDKYKEGRRNLALGHH